MESDDANKHLGLFFLMLTVKSKTYQFLLLPTFIPRTILANQSGKSVQGMEIYKIRDHILWYNL